jgi:2-polyprenyl-6-methoxyphenol hydroxylase-like FAD-dependent oxidoreductase
MNVIVVGGGIAGLTMALSLHQAGIRVRVCEAAQDVRPLGVGINLQPTAVRELTELGLAEELKHAGVTIAALNLFSKHGRLICSEQRGLSAGYRWPQYAIHRGRLQLLLWRAAQERLGEANVRSGLEFKHFTEHDTCVAATFLERISGKNVTEEADVLIGADGIHSSVRRQLYPNEGEPRFGGQILWRFAIEAEPLFGGNTQVICGHFRQRMIIYPIGLSPRTGELETNCICQIAVPGVAPAREDWNRRASRDAVLAAFSAWKFPWLDMPALIARAQEIFEFPLVDRDPVQTWTRGRVTLIGDAAHPMQPIGSQAGSQAIIDARVLTGVLAQSSDPSEALRRYDLERRPAMNDITLRNRQFGPEAAMQLVEDRAPNGFARISDVISQAELDEITTSFAVAAGLDAERVNKRTSFVAAPTNRSGHPRAS